MTSRQFNRAFKMHDYIFTWSYKFALGWLAIGGAGSAAVMILLSFDWLRIVSGSVFIGVGSAGAGLVYGLLRRADLYDELMIELKEGEEVEQPVAPQVTRPKDWVKMNLNNGRGVATIYQPKAGAFARWLREVLEDGKVAFSKRQAMARGFSDKQYDTTISQLKAVGLLHATETSNGTPVVTEHGKVCAYEWLKKRK